ncbi:bifunctional glutamate N-acetyltransferase/amino-acid acetyltransferase ArgJ [thiotrophic endosymbiont of Bathymodiolus puteoserpentis (Logatchev)]|uniref:bifunctional glutamate N-acetyltransferase/amino-acid acetyltransferase ArgJ n=1 Tax=thiotrophic endosymbiont of Bathymodiolus puteoserpentis (Logatchev) TaxID=343240 RepID=UPI0010B4CA79|nr:bifunctional glutamate N-acetyltransferase/amino-acid acetyltransferase ArgJ [thiotrophic endosymbiont of Bathymodiolus puteoserpentis (Logatchev)]SSC10060.1 Glutamate N-acetyltransferase / N-acetylglutamate synthase [thiotrophic endosymbiont of Bathymodiolus puteoserpentis (Logatchev)]
MKNSLLNIKGVSCAAINAGIKRAQNLNANIEELDLSIVSFAPETKTAAVFTQNVFCAAPVVVAKNHLNNNVRALVINSGNANAGTGVASGNKGLNNAYQVCEMVAQSLNIDTEQVLPFSTGVIGQPLPMQCFKDNIAKLSTRLANDNLSQVAQAILTTDLVEKTASKQFTVNGKTVAISGIAKGSGMIRPNMATMLSFIFTDVKASQSELQSCLTTATNQSFNRITVDGDTSTNDACSLSATGASKVELSDCTDEFQQALNEVTQTLAHKIIKDGEGATKFVEICVKGGVSDEDCLEVAYTVAHSLLVKTALFASDANWGRILAAVGRSNIAHLKADEVNIYLGGVCIVSRGELDEHYTEAAGSAEMAKDNIVVTIEIGKDKTSESVWTTDLSYDYIKINAEYRT